MKGRIKIKRISNDLNQDKFDEEKHLIITNNHILKKHYQNFKVSKFEIEKLKHKLKKINSEILLNQIIDQGDSIYSLVNEFYHEIIGKLESISDQISAISDCVNFLQELNLVNSSSGGTGSGKIHQNVNFNNNMTNNSSINGSIEGGRSSSMKISTKHFYLEKVNKLKRLEIEYASKNKEISFKNGQLEEDSKFLEKISKEKDLLIDSLSEDQLRRIGESYSHENQITAMKLILSSYFKTDIGVSATEKEIVEKFKVRNFY
jgi:uncharacterized coiled-coil protein SlyX